jgi:ATP:ADP antiporter, AAA family
MLAPLGNVRPAERRGAAAAFLTIFGILAGHTLLETARDALFLARLPPSELPGVYLVMAVVAMAVFQGPWRRPRIGGRRALSLVLVGSGLATFVFWILHSPSSPWALRALYVWTGLLGTMAALQFWIVLGELYTVTQAKRIYGLVGLGSVLGAIAGAALARALTQYGPPQHLILASAVVLIVTGLGPALAVRRPRASLASTTGAGDSSPLQTFRLFRNDPYIKALGGLVLVSTVALTLADYVFKSTVAHTVEPARLGTFFATFYMVLNVLALGAQLVLSGWLLRVMGLHRTMWVLPALVFMGAAGVALGGGLIAALLLKGADGTFRHSLHRTGTELLFVPLPDSLRSRAKPVIDVVGQRGGQALASLLILAEITQNRGNTVLAVAAAALCVVWIAWAADLKGHYLNLFRSALREGALRDRGGDLPALDLGSLETLFTALNSRDDAEVLGAMDLLAAGGRARLIPALILFHPSRSVVLRALEVFSASARKDFVSVAGRLLAHEDPLVRAAAVRAHTVVQADEALLRQAATDTDPLVRATALVGLVGGGWISDEAEAALEDLMRSPTAAGRLSLAAAIHAQHEIVPVLEALLLRLADDPDEEVQMEAATAMGVFRRPSFVPALMPMLASAHVRSVARGALVAIGEPALAELTVALADQHLPHEIRSHVPRTISRFPPEQAGPLLLGQLVGEQDGMVRYKILRGLGRLAAENPTLSLDPDVLRSGTERTLEAVFRLVHWRTVLAQGAAEDPRRATPGHELLVELLRDKEAHAVERVSRLLGLQYRDEDFEKIYRGLRSSTAKVKAGSRELLENLIQGPLREPVLALMDDVPDTQRLARASSVFRPAPLTYDELLARLIEEPGETVRCLAVYHVGELGLSALGPRLEAVRAERGAGLFLLRVVDRALALLRGTPGRLQHAG